MRFSTVLLAPLVALGVSGQAISAEKTVNNINGITSLSSDLDKTAKTVTLVNGFQTGPEVIKGFHEIVKKANKDYQEMQGGGSNKKAKRDNGRNVVRPEVHAALEARAGTTYTVKEQTAVCDALITFVKVHQALLATVIGKHGILEVTGVAYQMAAVLRGVEGVVDEIAFTIIAEVPHCAAKADEEKKKLDKSLEKAIDTYAGGLP